MRALGFYCFTPAPLEELPRLGAELLAFCGERQLQGTILLAKEGINAMLSGSPTAIREARKEFAARFPVKRFHEGQCSEHVFHRLLVKVKRSLIAVGCDNAAPASLTAPRLSPADLRSWIAEGRAFTLLDARNAYEVEVGTFQGATHLELSCSREFASKAKAFLADKNNAGPVVTFCTGGIRCEKASAVLLGLGVETYQLDGGILRYLEEEGAAYFEGSCFVYDWRLSVGAGLEPAPRSNDPNKSFGRHLL